jgi:hypothetical protein
MSFFRKLFSKLRSWFHILFAAPVDSRVFKPVDSRASKPVDSRTSAPVDSRLARPVIDSLKA